MTAAKPPRRLRLEPARRALAAALSQVEAQHHVSALDMVELLGQAQALLIDFVQRHPRAGVSPAAGLRGTADTATSRRTGAAG